MNSTTWAKTRTRILVGLLCFFLFAQATDKAFGPGTTRKLLMPVLPISLAIAFWNLDKPWAQRFLGGNKKWWQ